MVTAVSPSAELPRRPRLLTAVRSSPLLRRLFEFGTFSAFGVLPFALPVYVVVYVLHNGSYASDGSFFDLNTMWAAGRDIVHGRSPYPAFIYPAPAAVIMAPFGILPWRLAVVAFSIVSTSAVFATLRVLGVRDWRCYGACLVALPTASAIWIGTPTPLLALAVACAWRWRDRVAVVAIALTAVVATKLFLWPLFVWLLATRRFRAAFAGMATMAVVGLGAWAVIGFQGVGTYPRRLLDLAAGYENKGYSTLAYLHGFGLGGTEAEAAALAIGAIALAGVIFAAHRTGGDLVSFTVAIAAALMTSPIVWVHYLVLLFVPIAIVSPGLSALWLLPLALWPLGGQESDGSIPKLVLALCVVLVWLVSVARAWPRKESPAPTATASA